jgi:SSS family solute:Na+ symporter
LHLIDWILVIAINGAIIVYGLLRSRETRTSADWFLASRSLPWWAIGLSLYATAIDTSDLVADSGGTYSLGVSYLVVGWVGTVLGWIIAAHYVFLPMYRAGMYTNAEYLEARFGPAARVISALVQVQYRTMVMGIIATSMFLVFSIVGGMGNYAWWAVVGIALLATIYTALGGLRSVVVTDALQTVVMLVASLVFFFVVWGEVGGWDGLEAKLDENEPGLSSQMLHAGHDRVESLDVKKLSPEAADAVARLVGGEKSSDGSSIETRTSPWWVAFAFIVAGFAYVIVNHTQSMRMFGSRSEWDLKMSAVVASAVLLVMCFTNLTVGIMGRALHPDASALAGGSKDSIYPVLLDTLAAPWIKGLIVAGIVAAFVSTFDSIGSTLSALLVRDVYARLLKKDGDDRHYLRVGRWMTPVVVFGSFAYVPFLVGGGGMLFFYLDLVSVFVVPLLTIYLMGIFTGAHRSSGTIGLCVGVLYGLVRLAAPWVAESHETVILPPLLANGYASYAFSILITVATMVAVSLVRGWQRPEELRHSETGGWLRKSQLEVEGLVHVETRQRSDLWPILLGVLVIAIGVVLSFVVFW